METNPNLDISYLKFPEEDRECRYAANPKPCSLIEISQILENQAGGYDIKTVSWEDKGKRIFMPTFSQHPNNFLFAMSSTATDQFQFPVGFEPHTYNTLFWNEYEDMVTQQQYYILTRLSYDLESKEFKKVLELSNQVNSKEEELSQACEACATKREEYTTEDIGKLALIFKDFTDSEGNYFVKRQLAELKSLEYRDLLAPIWIFKNPQYEEMALLLAGLDVALGVPMEVIKKYLVDQTFTVWSFDTDSKEQKPIEATYEPTFALLVQELAKDHGSKYPRVKQLSETIIKVGMRAATTQNDDGTWSIKYPSERGVIEIGAVPIDPTDINKGFYYQMEGLAQVLDIPPEEQANIPQMIKDWEEKHGR